jgi:hypothetical protein
MWSYRGSATTTSAPVRRVVKVVAVVAGGLVAVMVLLSVTAAVFFSFVFNIDIKHRKHLDPIPIAASACPYVEGMHEAANRFQIAYPVLGASFDANMRELTWPETRARLWRATDTLDFSLAAGIPHFPVRVQRYLTTARNDVLAGRRNLALARSTSDFAFGANDLFEHGRTAFGYAGDLIGHRCSLDLGADADTMLYPYGTLTTSPRSTG